MNSTTEKILIVDDVSRNIQILGNILSQNQFQIAYAQSGKQAIDICETQDFDLVLLDIMMPEMDGYEVCERLKENPSTREIPIIFLTAKADMDSIIKGFEIGGQDYITKPFNAAELLARVNSHLLIRRQKKELEIMNSHLEDVVRERTYELETANHKLNILDKAKSNFLSIISHEIRTPLNGIIGLTELLNQSVIEEEQKVNIRFLKQASTRLMKFSNTALLITNLKIHNHLPEILPVSVSMLISGSIDEFKRHNDNSSLQIKNNSDSDNILIKVDSDLIRTCFLMIIENSAKFAGNDATLKIYTSINYNSISITFIDNGPGFSDEALNNLFELFAAGDLLHAEGTGLGLATSKLILDTHEGTIDVSNIEDGGAKVIIKLKYLG
jgi:two-component system sensor histidine kinase/response regulator